MLTIKTLISSLSKPVVIGTFLSLYLVFILIVFPNLSGDMNAAPPIDLAFNYSVEEVYGWIEAYGESGRQAYIRGEMTIDIVYPLIYTGLFIGLLGFLLEFRAQPSLQGYRLIILSPLIIWLFDLLENIGIVIMLRGYPEVLSNVATFTSFTTTTKWSAAVLVISCTLILGVRFLARRFQYFWGENK